jgi:hypothetical protein
MKNILLTLLLSITLLFALSAQEAIMTTGGNAVGSGGSASFSIGQVLYTTHADAEGSIAQGVQQAFEFSTFTGTDETTTGTDISVFPNPANDYLILEVADFENKQLQYQLLDINGRILADQIVTAHQVSITTTLLIPGTYFLKIMADKAEIKTFKIVKL